MASVLNYYLLAFTLFSVLYGKELTIQRRGQFGNPVDYFSKGWSDYKKGFQANGELWMGLDRIHQHTSEGKWGLRVLMTDWDGKVYKTEYQSFWVGPESTNYKLHVAGYDKSKSTLGDSMTPTHKHWDGYNLNGMEFSTMDKDNDRDKKVSCSKLNGGGGFWFNKKHTYFLNVCTVAGLNGRNYPDQKVELFNKFHYNGTGIYWMFGGARGREFKTFKGSEMKITKLSNIKR